MHVYLIGYRGSGKSTIGRKLATRLGRPFVDTDDEVEQTSGRTIREIFASEGETIFRDLEQAAIARVSAATTPTVISLGGGAILREANCQCLKAHGAIVWLEASAENLSQRIAQDSSSGDRRPDLTSRGGYAEVVEVLREREPIYRTLAEKTTRSDLAKPEDVVEEIAAWVKSRCC